jgi:molybdopterin-containing oxidoreductase family molybdopterin binding subunit
MLKWTSALAAGVVGLVAGVGGDMILRPTVAGPGVTTTATETATATGTATAMPERLANWTFNTCQGWGCHEACVLKTYTVNGKIDRTERWDLPYPEDGGMGICQKGLLAAYLPYVPNRILYPMKRVGNRGEGKFERITWDQALDEIAQKLNAIKDQYGPEAVSMQTFPCGSSPFGALGHGVLASRFVNVFGATSVGAGNVDTGPCAAWAVDGFPLGEAWTPWGGGMFDMRLAADSKWTILWGSADITTRPAQSARSLLQAKENGGKLIVIGLWFDPTAAKADQFIHVNGGTDAALGLAMCNVIIQGNMYDYDYLSKYTTAPFLVRNDNGNFLHESDMVSGGDKKKYVYVDKTTGKPASIAPMTFSFPLGTMPDLLAATTVNGIACETGFIKIKKNVASYTPEWQEPITGVSAKTVRDLANEYVEVRPLHPLIINTFGLRYQNSGRSCRAIDLLAALNGSEAPIGQEGYISHTIGLNNDALVYPDGPAAAKGKYLWWRAYVSAVTEGKPYPVKAMLSVVGNVLHSLPSRQLWEKVFNALDLFVVWEYRMSDTAMWADYVLPEAPTMERHDIANGYGGSNSFNHIILCEPAIPPQGEAKTPATWWSMLAPRLGVGQYFNKTDLEFIGEWIKSPKPVIAGIKPPLTLERLQKEKYIRANVPDTKCDPLSIASIEQYGFLSPSGRMEIYSDWSGTGTEHTAVYVEPLIRGGTPGTPTASIPDRKKFPFQFLAIRHRFTMQSQFIDIPIVQQFLDKEPLIRLNPKDASALGINEGDIVEAYNDQGSVKAKARFSEVYPPGTVAVFFAWHKSQFMNGNEPHGHTQYMLPNLSYDDTDDDWARARANTTSPLIFSPDGNELFWDAWCNVRKST